MAEAVVGAQLRQVAVGLAGQGLEMLTAGQRAGAA
jgi:hypothetical protein